MRIENHPVFGPDGAESVDIIVDGSPVSARDGDTVAVALWADDMKALRTSRTGQPRGMYCGIGHCFECRLTVETDGGVHADVRSCLTPVRPGMRVTTTGADDAER